MKVSCCYYRMVCVWDREGERGRKRDKMKGRREGRQERRREGAKGRLERKMERGEQSELERPWSFPVELFHSRLYIRITRRALNKSIPKPDPQRLWFSWSGVGPRHCYIFKTLQPDSNFWDAGQVENTWSHAAHLWIRWENQVPGQPVVLPSHGIMSMGSMRLEPSLLAPGPLSPLLLWEDQCSNPRPPDPKPQLQSPE